MFFDLITRFVCVSVFLSVCHHACGEMAGLSNMVSNKVNTRTTRTTRTRKCNTSQNDPFGHLHGTGITLILKEVLE